MEVPGRNTPSSARYAALTSIVCSAAAASAQNAPSEPAPAVHVQSAPPQAAPVTLSQSAPPKPTQLKHAEEIVTPESADPANMTPEQLAALQAAIIKASQNPVGNIAVIPFQNNFNYGVGPYNRLQYNLNLQPVVPIMLKSDLNLVARLIAPIVNNPSSAPPAVCASKFGWPGTFGIGDLNPQFYFAPTTKPGALIWGAGPQFLLPAGTPSTLSSGKYGAGPALVGLIMPGNIVTGVLAAQMWSIGGDTTKPNISLLFIQPFLNYNLKDGWTINLQSPGVTANWLASPQQGKWNVPLGGSVIRTFRLGPQPMQLALLYFGNFVGSANAPSRTIRFTWSLLYPIRRNLVFP